MNPVFLYIRVVVIFCVLVLFGFSVHAEAIDDTNKYARFLDSSYGTINFNPTNGSVDLSSSALTGHAWGNRVGWINLAPTNSGVVNDGSGNLSGYAWGENTGWINFNPTNGGVTVDSEGDFNGHAWSQNYGWIVFNCESDSTCATFDHKVSTASGSDPVPTPACSDGSDNDGDGLIDYPNDLGCESVNDDDESGGAGVVIVIPPATDPTDVCPNIEGIQETVPADMQLVGGQCMNPALDVCSNIEGGQSTIPEGYILDSFGNCSLPESDTDVCPNISGDQNAVPFGMVVDAFGNCVIPADPTDLCSNIPGDQETIPVNMVRDAAGNCINPIFEDPIEPPRDEQDDLIDNEEGEGEDVIVGGVIGDVVGGIGSVVEDSVEVARDFYDTPEGEVVTKTVSTTGVIIGGILALSSLFLNPASFTELAMAPFRIWSLLLSFLGLRKRYKPWGTVYDSVTKQPLDPAYVILQDENGNEVSSSITDLDGRYGFLTQTGTYRMVANKTNYTFPSKRLEGKTSDELYSNLYFGESLFISNESEVITKSIPMDPVNFDWNEFAKKNKRLMKFHSRFDFIIAKVSNTLFIIGFIVSIIALFIAPQPYNTIIFALYVGLILLRIAGLKPKSYGYLVDAETGNPYSFAIVRIMSTELNTEIAHKISDATGRYFCLIPNGTYYVKIEKKNPDETYEEVFVSQAIKVKRGIINQRFKI